MFKRIVCAVLIMLMLVCAFAACNDKPDNNGENNGTNEGGNNEGGNNNAGDGENNGGSTEGEGDNKPEEPKGELSFTLKEDDTYSVSVGTAKGLSKIEIPATHEGKPVTELGIFGSATADAVLNTSLTELVIPDTVTTAKANAFMGCTALKSVYITDFAKWCEINFENAYATPMYSAEALYVNGVDMASELTLTVPDGVGRIGSYALYSFDKVTKITVPDSVTEIGAGAFYSCVGMKSIEIGSGVAKIGNSAFTNCNSLSRVYIKDLAKWCAVAFEGNPSNPMCYANKLYLNGELLTSLVIPESVTAVSPRAFYGSRCITSVAIHGGVTEIGENAFAGCEKITEVINLSGLSITAGDGANGNIAKFAMDVHSGNSRIVTVGDYQFYTKNGTSHLIQYVGDDLELVLPESFNGKNYVIGKNAFYYYTELKSVVIPDTVTKICENAFFNCKSMTSVIIGNSVTAIENSAFSYCNAIQSLNIPDSVVSIGSSAFLSCIAMTRLDLGSGLTTIGAGAFSNCQKLEGVYIKSLEQWCSFNFPDQYSNPTACGKRLYLNGELLTEVTIPDSITVISPYAFLGCTELSRVILNDNVTSIGDYAFWNCGNLTGVTLGKKLTAIGTDVFKWCYKLVEIINRSSMELNPGREDNGSVALNAIEIHKGDSKIIKVDDYLFYICDKGNYLISYTGSGVELILPESYNGESYVINSYAFYSNSRITSVTFSEGVTDIGGYAFAGCAGLQTVNFSESIKTVGGSAFLYSGAITTVNIPDIALWCAIQFGDSDANPITVARKAYVNGELLTNLVIPEGVTGIGRYAFKYCNSIASVTVPSSMTMIDTYAFQFCYKLAEVINHSELEIRAKSIDFGQIANYALEVHSGESKLDNVNGYLFYTNKGTSYLLGYAGEDTQLVLPESYKGGSYVLYDYAFFCRDDITSVIISKGVTAIGNNAFRSCGGLATVEIGENVTKIGSGAFHGVGSLENVTFKNTKGWKAGDKTIPSADLTDSAKTIQQIHTNADVTWERS